MIDVKPLIFYVHFGGFFGALAILLKSRSI
jgi:hypothetical protein